MDFETLRAFCLAFPGATEEVQWGHDLLFKVGGKTFVFAGFEPPFAISIKCSDDDFADLIEREGIIPAPYLARNKWVMFESLTVLSRSEMEKYIRKSYDAIVSNLSKRVQASLKS